MYKLVILIESIEDQTAFDEGWPQFLHLAERMPGLQKETTSRVDHLLYGRYPCVLLHELYFDSLPALQEAMGSPSGRSAGEWLQRITGGQLTLLISDHKEDNLENIRKYTQPGEQDDATTAQPG